MVLLASRGVSRLLFQGGRGAMPSPSLLRLFHGTGVLRGQPWTFPLADVGEGIKEVEILSWSVKPGDRVRKFDVLCEVQSDKASLEISSPVTGTVEKLHWKEGELAQVRAPLVDFDVEGRLPPSHQHGAQASSSSSADEGGKEEKQQQQQHQQEEEQKGGEGVLQSASAHAGKPLATPAVRRIAKEHSVDLGSVPATGRGGRILKEDILRFLKHIPEASDAGATTTSPAPAFVSGQDRKEAIRGLKRTMVKSMTDALAVPHFGFSDDVRMDRLMELRNRMKPLAEARGIKLTFMPFFIKAYSMALKQYPVMNATVNRDCTEITYKGSHNIGIGMDTPAGLLVPNIKHCEQRTVLEIAAELNRLQELGKSGKLGQDDLTGGTFTISNVGPIGGTYAQPVIFLPEVAIVALGQTQKLPRFDADGNVVAAHILGTSYSCDHRVVDGATCARLSQLFKSYIEDPGLMLAELR